MKKILVLLILSLGVAFGGEFNFQEEGNAKAIDIIKNTIDEEIVAKQAPIVAYFIDIDHDGKKEIVALIKYSKYYSLSGYKLLIFEKMGEKYREVDSDIYFDESKNVLIEDSVITYYKSSFHGFKKCRAKYEDGKLTTYKGIDDIFRHKKLSAIEQVTTPQDKENPIKLDLEDLNSPTQRSVKIKYRNLSEKTKHYLDMK